MGKVLRRKREKKTSSTAVRKQKLFPPLLPLPWKQQQRKKKQDSSACRANDFGAWARCNALAKFYASGRNPFRAHFAIKMTS